jgi:hypothetical protein
VPDTAAKEDKQDEGSTAKPMLLSEASMIVDSS